MEELRPSAAISWFFRASAANRVPDQEHGGKKGIFRLDLKRRAATVQQRVLKIPQLHTLASSKVKETPLTA